MLEVVNGLAPAVTDAVVGLITAVQAEIVALLRAIRFAGTSGSVTVSAEVAVG